MVYMVMNINEYLYILRNLKSSYLILSYILRQKTVQLPEKGVIAEKYFGQIKL